MWGSCCRTRQCPIRLTPAKMWQRLGMLPTGDSAFSIQPGAGVTVELPPQEAVVDQLNDAVRAAVQGSQAAGAPPDSTALQSAGGDAGALSLPSVPDLRGLQDRGGEALEGARESLERAFQGLGETAGSAAAALRDLTGAAGNTVQDLTGSTSKAVQSLSQGGSNAVTQEAQLAAEQLAATRESLAESVARYYDLLPPEARALLGAGELARALPGAARGLGEGPPAWKGIGSSARRSRARLAALVCPMPDRAPEYRADPDLATLTMLAAACRQPFPLLPQTKTLRSGGDALLAAAQWASQSPPVAAAAFLLPAFLLWRVMRGGFSGTLSAEDLAAALSSPGKGGVLVVDIRDAATRSAEGIPSIGDAEGCAAVALPVPKLDPGLAKMCVWRGRRGLRGRWVFAMKARGMASRFRYSSRPGVSARIHTARCGPTTPS